MKYGFGVDVGGTTVKLGLLSEAGELLEKWELPSRTENGGSSTMDCAISAWIFSRVSSLSCKVDRYGLLQRERIFFSSGRFSTEFFSAAKSLAFAF